MRWKSLALLLFTATILFSAVAPAQLSQLPARCTGLCRPNRSGHFVSPHDLLRTSAHVDGDDLLALVNRSPTGALAPDYAPRDLIDLATRRPRRARQCTPPGAQCLRRPAARAYLQMARAMRRQAHVRPYVSSAFRAYPVQCATFLSVAERGRRGGFCRATSASALPGHSQHQLGTSLDLFTYEWEAGGSRFRRGYGCSAGGRWLAAHAHEFGFVLPYPLHPDYRRSGSSCAAERGLEDRIDPRTGYRYEPWHLRFIGRDNAQRFHRAFLASPVGTAAELTLEQWLRAEARVSEPISAPVCDGCNCSSCATTAGDGPEPCTTPAIVLDAQGRSRTPPGPPRLLSVAAERSQGLVLLTATLSIPQNTMTQPPVVTRRAGAHFRRGRRRPSFRIEPSAHFVQLNGAWRLALGPGRSRRDWPWRAALVRPFADGVMNGINAAIPAAPGEAVEVVVPLSRMRRGSVLRVGLSDGGPPREVRRVRIP